MASPLSLTALAALAVSGTGFGVYLGKSAIAQIDPVYFSSPAPGSRFHSDLVANPPAFGEASPVLQKAAIYEEVKCSGCTPGLYQRYYSIDPYEYEFAPIEDDYLDDYAELDAPPAEEPGKDVVTVVRGTEDVVRYAYYQVSSEDEDEAAPETRVAVAEPACSGDCSTEEPSGI